MLTRRVGVTAHGLAVFAALAGAGVAIVGCGSTEPSELAATLPGDSGHVSYLDIDTARTELGLPDDADPVDPDAIEAAESEEDTPEAELAATAINVLPHVRDGLSERFELDATAAAIDHSQVSAAAAAYFVDDGPAAVLETDQSFDEIASRLEAAGFQADGEVLDGESVEPEPALPFVADAGDDRVVVTADREQAEEAIEGDEEPGETASLLDELDAPDRQASSNYRGSSCVESLAVGGVPGSSELELVIRVEGIPEASRVADEVSLLAGLEPARLAAPQIDGDLVRVDATVPPERADPGEFFASGALTLSELYDCG